MVSGLIATILTMHIVYFHFDTNFEGLMIQKESLEGKLRNGDTKRQ